MPNRPVPPFPAMTTTRIYRTRSGWAAYAFTWTTNGSELVDWGFATGQTEEEALCQAREAPEVRRAR